MGNAGTVCCPRVADVIHQNIVIFHHPILRANITARIEKWAVGVHVRDKAGVTQVGAPTLLDVIDTS